MSSGSEEEQLAQIREWWQRNGKPLLAGGAVALALVLGWQAWQSHQAEQAQQASALYQQLLTEALDGDGTPDTAQLVKLGEQLQGAFDGQAYAQYGRLMLARVAVDEARLEDAAAELRAVVAAPANAVLAELASQRLAQVLGAQGKPQQGLDQLTGEAPTAFAASREELRGDLLLQLGKRDEARAAYRKAMEASTADAALGALQMKLDDLAQGEA